MTIGVKVAFSGNRSKSSNRDKKSPLAGWLGKKGASEEDQLPEIDVANGLSRALRGSGKTAPKPESDGGIREALSAIEAALYAIDRVRDILEQACEVAISARDVEDSGGRALLAESYDEIRLSINESLERIDPRAAQLIGKNAKTLDVNLGGKARYSVSAFCLDATDKGLDLAPPRDAFESEAEINHVVERLDKALARADRAASGYCRDAQYLMARLQASERAVA